jgi:hypothetical protein
MLETVVAPGTAATDVVRNGADSLVLVDPPVGVTPTSVDNAAEIALATATLNPAMGRTIRDVFVGALTSGNRGETFAEGAFPSPDARRGVSFVSTTISTPYTVAHEIGHTLTDKQANQGHYRRPAVPVANRLHADQNLMRAGTATTERVDRTKRLWDDADADGSRQVTTIRSSLFTRGFV